MYLLCFIGEILILQQIFIIFFILQNIIKKVNGQKFVYKFVSFPEITKTETKVPFSVKMSKFSNPEDGLNLGDGEENGSPPSPTLSSSPPSLVVSKSEPQDDYFRYYMQQYQANSSLAKTYDQTTKYPKSSQQSVSALAEKRIVDNETSQASREHSHRHSQSASSHDVWRPGDASKATLSSGTKHNDVANLSLSATLAALSASSLSEEDRVRAATAALWAGFQQASSVPNPQKDQNSRIKNEGK